MLVVPVKVDVALVDDPNEPPEPVTTVQAPVPTVGEFPARVAVVPHTALSAPAFAWVGIASTVKVAWALVTHPFELLWA